MAEPDTAALQASVLHIKAHLSGYGLACFGSFTIERDEITDAAPAGLADRTALLFGNAGGAMWQHFSVSPEHGDGKPDPMNRWTSRVAGEALAVGEGQDMECLYPFGAPVWPFQRWAKRAMGLKSSPLGLLIHPKYGLWFALRAAIVLPSGGQLEDGSRQVAPHRCDGCSEKPCLSACPVGAYSGAGFNAAACRSHLASQNEPDCMMLGCAARNACPVGAEWRYSQAQLQFHMTAFNR
ncbi:MAG: ferredoxin [Nitratireductor sp.]|nr:ferredoxin [Nitratireductor sp.]